MISAVINTYNEEKNIERCLSSLSSWVSEIIIVDMGSKDKTLDLARHFKTKIYTHPHTGFVEPARNFALTKAQGDWILLIDADEEIPHLLSELLLSYMKSTISFLRIPRKNIIFGRWMRHAQWWPDYQIRFFKKGAVFWSDKIHSIPLTRGEGIDIEAKEEYAIVHHNYQTIEQFLDRLNRYTTIQAKEMYLEGKKFSWKDLLHEGTREFVSRFFANEGYKDGVHGLVASLLQSYSISVIYAKLWELEGFNEGRIDLDEFKAEETARSKEETYWILEKQLEKEPPLISKLKLKLEKRLQT
ncbi:glycosyltransferase family 2 protein [Candidatus Gottesmanbacteria bacterium]|nr:glycosyltransferase family 2 protein [Candidatus Gottesmanbacteria bacterium]